MIRSPLLRRALIATFASVIAVRASSQELKNLDYIAEHLPEVTMDNRHTTLPLWGSLSPESTWRFGAQGAYSAVRAERNSIKGALSAFAVERAVGGRWSIRAIAFYDAARASSEDEIYRLSPTFLRDPPPLSVPASARFDGLTGSLTQFGAALVLHRVNDNGWLDGSTWSVGVVLIRQSLDRYRSRYVILDGMSAGSAGAVDYSATYSFATPLLGMRWREERGNWIFSPHWRYLIPIPRKGFVGAIDGPGFDLRGDSGTAGQGKYVSDQQLAIGLAVTHRTSGVSLDLGMSIAQYALEPLTHPGVDTNLALAVGVEF